MENRIKKQNQYQENLVDNRAKQRKRYAQDLKNNRAKKRQRYQNNLEINRAKKRQQYKQDVENNRAKKRCKYNQNIENNRSKKRDKYQQDSVKQRALRRIYYLNNFQYEQDRQKKLDSDRKWLYNKRYYEKIKSLQTPAKSVIEIKNHDIIKKITKKYENIWSKNSIKVRHSLEIYIKDIAKKLNIKGHI